MELRQTAIWQHNYLQRQKRARYADLYWYVERRLEVGQHPVSDPLDWIPTVPVAPNPTTSLVVAKMLAYFFQSLEPDCEYAPVLVSGAVLDELQQNWYVWDESIPMEVICERCAAIGVVAHNERFNWRCEHCLLEAPASDQ